MRIAFDLDETLIPGRDPFPLEPLPKNPFRRRFCTEPLREGAPALIRQIWQHGHEVWIYTTSFRKPLATRLMFRAYGARIGKVINVPVHKRRMRRFGEAYKTCTKYPPAFAIDLLIDNCEGVAAEARKYNYEMLLVEPGDPDWIDKIRTRLNIT